MVSASSLICGEGELPRTVGPAVEDLKAVISSLLSSMNCRNDSTVCRARSVASFE